MADFSKAFVHTMGHEGGYVNDPEDAGGETYRGIARQYHPEWSGWEIIDKLKKQNVNFESSLSMHAELNQKVEAFYKLKFWDRFLGDHIPDQSIAEELFDTCVNMGVGRAVRFLQKGLNILNRNEFLYDDISVDGGFGTITLNTLKTFLAKDEAELLLKVMNILQGMHYIEYMTNSPIQEKFARGWLKRVTLHI